MLKSNKMKKNNYLLPLILIATIGVLVAACVKDRVAVAPPPPPAPPATVSFVEEFNNVGDLSGKGWVFKNNSNPIGEAGWRQGRYESAALAQYKFLAPVPFLGFPAYSAKSTPNDFVSCDVSCANDSYTGTSNISAWLISPAVAMKNGDQIVFWARATDDSYYAVYCKDRMQVRANFTDGSADVGGTDASVGKFTTLLLDINPDYIYNDASGNPSGQVGFPRVWTKYTLTLSGLPAAGIPAGRFAFRYFGADAGLWGGTAGANYPTVVGVDALEFIHD
jgi:hypothetical protein